MKSIPIIVGLALGACGSGIAGNDYGGGECPYDRISFRDDGVVYLTFIGVESPGTYRTDGDKIAITAANGQDMVFTRNGGALEAGPTGEKTICEAL